MKIPDVSSSTPTPLEPGGAPAGRKGVFALLSDVPVSTSKGGAPLAPGHWHIIASSSEVRIHDVIGNGGTFEVAEVLDA